MNGSARLLAPYLRRHWRALAVATGASVVSAAAEVARPFPLKLVIDDVLGDRGNGPFSLHRGDVTLLAVVAGLVIAIALCDAGASYLVDVRLERAGERIVHDLRAAVYGHLQRLSLAFHEKRPTGDLVTRVTGDVNAVGELFSDSLGTIATSTLLLVGMAVVTVRIDPVMALAAFSVTPVLATVTVRFRRQLKSVARKQRATEGSIASLAGEALSSMRVVKALASEDYERDRVVKRSEEVRQAGIEAAQIEGRFTGIIDVTGAAATAIVLVLGVFRVASGHLTLGDLIVVNSYVRRIYRPLRDIARQASRVSRAMARGDRIAEVLGADELLEEAPGAYRGERAAGDVELENVTFSYGREAPVLRDVSLRIPPGQRTALVGPSGAGKSTIASLIARFYDPEEGRVLIDNRDVRTCALSWLREQVGLVLQDTVLFSGTVAENISYGTEATLDEVVSAATSAGAHEFVSALSNGYDTMLGPWGVGLSGGQRQRIAIARTLLRNPPILVLDEPTTGLDAESEAAVLAGLDVLMQGRTVVMVTHSLALARTADRVTVVDGGRVTQVGSPAELLSTDGVFRHLATLQGVGYPMAVPVSTPPHDQALPTMPAALDADAMTPVLRRALGGVDGGGPWPDVRVHCLRYKPGTNLVVHYLVELDGTWHDATAMIAGDRNLAKRAALPRNQALARQVNGRSPAASPLYYDDEVRALVQWLPLDIQLPALAAPPANLRLSLRSAGVPVDGSEPRLLAYRPRRRAVLRMGDHVLKIYADRSDYERAVRGLQAAAAVDDVPTPVLQAALADLRLTVQGMLIGTGIASAGDVAVEAGRLIAALHSVPGAAEGLEALGPPEQLRRAAQSASLAATVVPALAPRVERLLGELDARRPDGVPLVLSHGDFHAGQLLADGDELALLDLDETCLAPPALDVANYAAHLVRGAEPDPDTARTCLERVVAGYGQRPDALGWYVATAILRRSPFPFRFLTERWPDGVSAQVDAARAALRW